MAGKFHLWSGRLYGKNGTTELSCSCCEMPYSLYEEEVLQSGLYLDFTKVIECPYACYADSKTSCCGWEGGSRYDYHSHKWVCRGCGSETFPSELLPNKTFYIGVDEKKCTCGSEKTYGANATHSNWCDLNAGKK